VPSVEPRRQGCLICCGVSRGGLGQSSQVSVRNPNVLRPGSEF
jgi:hypothetical protein